MSPADMRTVTSTAEAKGMTAGELRAYVARLNSAQCPDEAHPAVRVTITGRIHSLTTKFDVIEPLRHEDSDRWTGGDRKNAP